MGLTRSLFSIQQPGAGIRPNETPACSWMKMSVPLDRHGASDRNGIAEINPRVQDRSGFSIRFPAYPLKRPRPLRFVHQSRKFMPVKRRSLSSRYLLFVKRALTKSVCSELLARS